jgi:hypothetical protein
MASGNLLAFFNAYSGPPSPENFLDKRNILVTNSILFSASPLLVHDNNTLSPSAGHIKGKLLFPDEEPSYKSKLDLSVIASRLDTVENQMYTLRHDHSTPQADCRSTVFGL